MSLNISGFLINKILSDQEVVQVFDTFQFTNIKKHEVKTSFEMILDSETEKIWVANYKNSTFFFVEDLYMDELYIPQVSQFFPECELFYFYIHEGTGNVVLYIYQNAKLIRQLECISGEYSSKFKPITEESTFLWENYKKLTKAQVFEIYDNSVVMSDVWFEFFNRYFWSDFDILSDDFFFSDIFDVFEYKNPRYFSRADFNDSPEYFQRFLDAINFQ